MLSMDVSPLNFKQLHKIAMEIRRTQYRFARLVSCYYKIDFDEKRLKHATFVSVHTVAASASTAAAAIIVVVAVVFVRIARSVCFFI